MCFFGKLFKKTLASIKKKKFVKFEQRLIFAKIYLVWNLLLDVSSITFCFSKKFKKKLFFFYLFQKKLKTLTIYYSYYKQTLNRFRAVFVYWKLTLVLDYPVSFYQCCNQFIKISLLLLLKLPVLLNKPNYL